MIFPFKAVLGLLSLSFNILSLFPFVHDLLGLYVWKDSRFPSFSSYALQCVCSPLDELDEQSTQTGDSVSLPLILQFPRKVV